MRQKAMIAGVFVVILAASALAVYAGVLNPTTPPESTFSYTLESIYQRLANGVAGAPTTWTEPSGGPTAGTGHTLDEVMAAAPVADNINGATPGNVLSGVTYWSLRTSGSPWGLTTGAMPNRGAVAITPITTNQAIAAGYHNGAGYVVGDSDLVSGNVHSGVTLFGVNGNPNVVNTASGDATAADLALGKKAWVDGAEVTGTDYPAPVARTGQTTCYNAAGTLISCAGTGQDGESQNGVAWPDPRFTDNLNGAVTDNLTGLVWLKNAGCTAFFSGDTTGSNIRNWTNALAAVNLLSSGYCGLSDGSVAGDWHVPNVKEMVSIMDYSQSDPALPPGHPFTNVYNSYYWTSSTYLGGGSYNYTGAWLGYINSGTIHPTPKTQEGYNHIWAVRNGE